MELQQQISDRDEEIEQLRHQLADECQLSTQRLEDAQRQVLDVIVFRVVKYASKLICLQVHCASVANLTESK